MRSSRDSAGSRPTPPSGLGDTSELRRSSGSICRGVTTWRAPRTSSLRGLSGKFVRVSGPPENASQIYLLGFVTLHVPAWIVAEVRKDRVDAGLRFRLARFV